MKLIFTIFISMSFYLSQAQNWNYNFDPPVSTWYAAQFIIDTSHHHNSWQIGKPQKTTFDSAYSYPNAIVTDTLNSYPKSDTSVFTIIEQRGQSRSHFGMVVHIRFKFKLQIDSGEIAKVELSGDRGLHWINVMTEDTTYDFDWDGPKPRLDTTNTGWSDFKMDYRIWANALPSNGQYPNYYTSDTMLFRFTFISDSIQTNKDGWMMDNFDFADYAEGIETVRNNNLISIYPNPSDGMLYIKNNSLRTSKTQSVSIFNLLGQNVYEAHDLPANGRLHLQLPDGMYVLKYTTDNEYAIKQLAIKN
jgi:hypothetical protein